MAATPYPFQYPAHVQGAVVNFEVVECNVSVERCTILAMPSIIPGYVYTLFSSSSGVIIVAGCTMATLNVRTEAVNQQLSNVEQSVAAQSLALEASNSMIIKT